MVSFSALKRQHNGVVRIRHCNSRNAEKLTRIIFVVLVHALWYFASHTSEKKQSPRYPKFNVKFDSLPLEENCLDWLWQHMRRNAIIVAQEIFVYYSPLKGFEVILFRAVRMQEWTKGVVKSMFRGEKMQFMEKNVCTFPQEDAAS